MAVKFFGQFLIDKKVISKRDLLCAIDLQDKANLRFGDLVIKLGLMTKEQIALTHNSQRHEDLQFGDMAVKMGFLSQEQVRQVLEKQHNEHLYIGEALVQLDIITTEALNNYLSEFKQSQENSVPEKIIIPATVPHRQVWEIVTDMTCKMLTRIAGATFRTAPCTITRNLSKQPIIVEAEFSGSVSAHYILSVSENSGKLIAKAILKKSRPATTTEIERAVKEFVNIVCSNVTGKATQSGYGIDVTPAQIIPQSMTTYKIPETQLGLLFPIHFSDGEQLELVVTLKKEQECH